MNEMPMISINKKWESEYHDSLNDLCRPVITSVTSGDFDEVTALMADGTIVRFSHPVVKSKIIKHAATLIHFIYRPKISIVFKVAENVPPDLDCFKQYLFKSIRKDRMFWSSGFSPDALVDIFAKCKTAQQVVEKYKEIYGGNCSDL